MRDSDGTRLLGWPGYRVYPHEIDDKAKQLNFSVRRKRGSLRIVCSGCGKRCTVLQAVLEREESDLPFLEYRTTVLVELYRVKCTGCGPKIEKVDEVMGKVPYTKRFEDAVR